MLKPNVIAHEPKTLDEVKKTFSNTTGVHTIHIQPVKNEKDLLVLSLEIEGGKHIDNIQQSFWVSRAEGFALLVRLYSVLDLTDIENLLSFFRKIPVGKPHKS
ncbi:MAG: hypothetical protein OXH06_15215 [Gemmatimonadetes bacterium]|nr:hypothetical protein [Gemmatimonadota bacterium]